MRAMRGDGNDLIGAPRHEHWLPLRVAGDHAPVRDLGTAKAQREVRAAQLSVLSTHFSAPFDGRRVVVLQAVAPAYRTISMPTITGCNLQKYGSSPLWRATYSPLVP